MEISIWVVFAIITRWLVYCGLAALVAAPTLPVISSYNRQLPLKVYAATAALLAGLGSVAYFFIQVGSLSESGWAGMFDPVMRDILWQSGHGDALVYRLLSIVILLGLCVLPVSDINKAMPFIFYALALILLGLSFSATGHTTSLSAWVYVVLGVHVVVAFWWVGSLLPLAQACHRLQPSLLYQSMHSFGRVAMILVAVLCVLGVVLALQLVGSIERLFTSTYGQALLVKIVLVISILLLAARHKWRCVPALLQQELQQEQAHDKLAFSIKCELFLGLVILLLTALLTSAVGPE